jgi:hypothetical protein
MRKHIVESQLHALRNTFGDGLVPVSRDQLWPLFKKKDYTGIVKFVRDSMHLGLRIRVGIAKSESSTKAPAWVEMPGQMPLLGTLEFERTLATIFLSKAFLAKASFEQVVMAIAHEMSHIVLSGLRHPLQREETAVDLTAMLLGFRDFYIEGCQTTTVKRKFNGWVEHTHRLGYLTKAEVDHAGHLLGYARPWWNSCAAKELKQLLRPLALIAAILGVAFSTDHKFQSQIKVMLRQIEASASFTLLVGIALGILACLALHRYRTRKPVPQRNYWKPSHRRAKSSTRQEETLNSKSADFEIHRAFSNVFALMSVERRQALISYYQKQFDCDASEAMQIAIEDFRKESQRYG